MRGVAGGDGRDDELGHADGKASEGRRHQGRATRSAGGQQPGDIGLGLHPALEGEGHAGHGTAAVAGEDACRTARMMARHDIGRRVGARRLAAGGQVDHGDAQAGGLDDVAHVAQLGALGVKRSADIDGAAPRRGGRHRTACRSRGLGRRRDGARRTFDDMDRHIRRPAGRELRIGQVDADRAALGRRRGLAARRIGPRRLVMGMAADAEKRLLQVAVGGEHARLHHPVDLAVDHDRDAVGDGTGDADILLDHQDVDVAFLAQTHQHFGDLVDDHRGKALGRLVHHQKARVEEQRPADGEHLLFAAGQLPAAIAAALGQARKHRIDALGRPGAALGGDELQMLVDRQRAPQAAPLRHVADAHAGDLGRGAAGNGLPGQRDRPGAHRHQAHDRLAQGGLAHAVAADDRQDAAADAQVHALQRVAVAVIDVEVADLENGRALSHARLRDTAPGPRDRPRSRPACLP